MKKNSGLWLLTALLVLNLAACGQSGDSSGYAADGTRDGALTGGTDTITGTGSSAMDGTDSTNRNYATNGTGSANGSYATNGTNSANGSYANGRTGAADDGGYYGGGTNPDSGYYGAGTGSDGYYDRAGDVSDGSMLDRAGDALENGVRDAKNGLDNAGDALMGR